MARAWIIMSFFVCFSAFGQSVILPEEPLTITRSGQGCYGPLWQELTQRVPALKSFFVPLRRAHDLFLRSTFDCFFPFAGEAGLDIFDIDPKKVVISHPVNQLGVYLLTREKEFPSLAKITNDPGIRVAASLGAEKLVQDWKAQFYWVDESRQAYGMIGLNRVDYIVATFPDSYAYFRQSGLKVVAPLMLSTDNFMCKNTELGENTVERVNEVIEEMKKDGTLAQKLGDCFFSYAMVPLQQAP